MNKYEWFYKEEVVKKEVEFAIEILKTVRKDDNPLGFIYSCDNFCNDKDAIKALKTSLEAIAKYYMDTGDMELDYHIESVDSNWDGDSNE